MNKSGFIPVNNISLLLILLFLSAYNAFGQYSVEGRVIDSDTGEPLPFVNIIIEGTRHGTLTNVDGLFEIRYNEPIEKLRLSFVGYESKQYSVGHIRKKLLIELEQKPIQLHEVVIYPGENPAHRIINNVIEHRGVNDPESLRSFRYNFYSKFLVTAEIEDEPQEIVERAKPQIPPGLSKHMPDDVELPPLEDMSVKDIDDEVPFDDLGDEVPFDDLDDDVQTRERMRQHLEDHHLFITETYSERKYLYPNLDNENVIASRVAGFKSPVFVMLTSQLQSFSFYDDYIEILNAKYLSPIAPNSTSRYFFNLEDTLYSGNDSTFVISYRPGRGRNFEGLKGVLYINTYNWAVQNVIAEPASEEEGVYLCIRQKYELIDSLQWFPVEQHTTVEIDILPKETLIGEGRIYIENIELNPELRRRDFSAFDYYWDEKVSSYGEDFWEKHRRGILSGRELNTYQFIDSLGHEHEFDRLAEGMVTLFDGRVPWWIFDIDLARVLNYNRYEGLRLGVPLRTNHKLFNRVTLKGYGAYGFKDKEFKYGFGSEVMLHRKSDLRIGFDHSNDVAARGITGFYHPFNSLLNLQANLYSTLPVRKMDESVKNTAWIGMRTFRNNLSLKLGFTDERLTLTDEYRFAEAGLQDDERNIYRFTETSLQLRFALGEVYIFTPARIVPFFSRNIRPIVYLNIAKGWDNILSGEFDYWKAEMLFQYHYNIRMLGMQRWSLQAGIIDRSVPWQKLFSAPGMSPIPLSVGESFITMEGQSMVSDQYAALFFWHNFGSLLFRKGRVSPEFTVFAKGIYGNIRNPGYHLNADFNTPSRGYYETGLTIGKIPFLTENSNINISIAYNFGYYSQPDFIDNLGLGLSYVFMFE